MSVENEGWNTVGANSIRPNIEIYSMSGTLAATFPSTGAATSINVSQLPNGAYILKVGKYAGKFVKQ